MATIREDRATEVTPLEALKRLNALVCGFMASQALATGCNLGVFEELGKGKLSSEKLAGKIRVHPDGCRRLLAALRQLGLVEEQDGAWKNSALGEYLTSQSPVPLEAAAMLVEPFYHMWEFLPDALREMSPRWQQALGTTAEEAFAALYEDPARLNRFTRCMDAISIPEGREIASWFDFAPYHCVMDVAGGPAGLSIEICKRYSHLRGIVMDLPPVCRIAEERIQAAGLQNRFKSVSADLFKGPYPDGADVITLSWVLHDWSDESCLKILRNCYAALPATGVLLVNEIVLNDDHSGTEFGTLMSLHMAIAMEPGSKERSQSEYRALLEEAGFHLEQVIRYGGVRDLIVARKL